MLPFLMGSMRTHLLLRLIVDACRQTFAVTWCYIILEVPRSIWRVNVDIDRALRPVGIVGFERVTNNPLRLSSCSICAKYFVNVGSGRY